LPEAGDLGAATPMGVSYMTRQDTNDEAWPSPPDPGDLSRRLARRRAELRLSTAQVAARAGCSLRYLEYLERDPARIDATVLRRLAAALQTSPAALLGGGAGLPPGHAPGPIPGHGHLSTLPGSTPPPSAPPAAAAARGRATRPRSSPARGRATRRLKAAECWRLITPGGVGRIAFSTPAGPVVLPVNYAVIRGAIVLRTEHGTLIEAHAYDKVAFEVDHIDDALCQGWSVLVAGQAHIVAQTAELRHLHAETDLLPWPEGEHDVWVRIAPTKVTGRRIESQ
jgi:nitroimidazol reductase NimA-like FMN-containing flavoprotein (pyridoxamine 5'-phosphate oxidase superfamily)/transcriptional regulator with XRE-family HTH domain